jgi:hypothetical protein
LNHRAQYCYVHVQWIQRPSRQLVPMQLDFPVGAA